MEYQPGTYGGSLLKAVFSEAGNGTPQFVLRFNVTNQLDGGEWVDIEPGERSVYLSMKGGAADYTQKKLQSLGIGVSGPPEMVEEDGDQVVVLPEGIADEFIELKAAENTYNGSVTIRWDIAKWGGGGMGKTASAETVAKLKTMWKA